MPWGVGRKSFIPTPAHDQCSVAKSPPRALRALSGDLATRLTVVPRLAVRLALRNQVARGRGRSSHVVFIFAESLDVCRDFTRSQRRSAVNWPVCKFLMFATRGMTPCPNAFKKFSHRRTLWTLHLPTRLPCCWQRWQSSFSRVKALVVAVRKLETRARRFLCCRCCDVYLFYCASWCTDDAMMLCPNRVRWCTNYLHATSVLHNRCMRRTTSIDLAL